MGYDPQLQTGFHFLKFTHGVRPLIANGVPFCEVYPWGTTLSSFYHFRRGEMCTGAQVAYGRLRIVQIFDLGRVFFEASCLVPGRRRTDLLYLVPCPG